MVGGAQGVGCMARYSNFNVENIQYLRNFLENKCNNWHRPSWLDVDCNVGELMRLAVFFLSEHLVALPELAYVD